MRRTQAGVRGEGLRELEDFFSKHDNGRDYAGLRRIGDDDGLAVWTKLTDPAEVKKALEARADARREEAKRGEAFFTKLVNGTQEPPSDEPRRPGPCCVVV